VWTRIPGALSAPVALRIGVVAVAYFAAARFGLSLAFTTKQVTAVWPPTGIALVAFLIWGIRMWPGVFVAALLANAMTYEGLSTAVGIAAGNTCAGILGAVVLIRFRDHRGKRRDWISRCDIRRGCV